MPNGQVGVFYLTQLSAACSPACSGSIVWTIASGQLPNGFVLDQTNGTICTGTQNNDLTASCIGTAPANAQGNWVFTIQATDSSVPANFTLKQFLITVLAASPPSITNCGNVGGTCVMPNAVVGQAYSYQFTESGGLAPITWLEFSSPSAYPPGFTLNASTGVFSTAQVSGGGIYTFQIQVRDSQGVPSSAKQFTLTIGSGQPTITVTNSGGNTVTLMVFNVPAGTSQTNATYQQVLTVRPSQGPATLSLQLQSENRWLYLNGLNNSPITMNNVPTATGAPLTVSVSTIGLVPGTFTAMNSAVCYANTQNCVTISVSLNVTTGTSGVLTANPNTLSFTAMQGSTLASPSSQNLEILTNSTVFGYALIATEQSGGAWITFPNGNSGIENSTLVPISVFPAILPTLSMGTYTGTITATDSANNTVSIPVTLTITTGTVLTPSPLSFSFSYQVNGTLPPAQTLTVSSNSGTVGFSIRMTPSVSWLNPSALGGTATASTPATITLTVSPGVLPPGAYTTNIIITPLGGFDLAPIPVRLVVGNQLAPQGVPTLSTWGLGLLALLLTGYVVLFSRRQPFSSPRRLGG